MIRILDANALISLYHDGKAVRAEQKCYVPEEIADELRSDPGAEAWLKTLPLESVRLDEVEYLQAYADYVNRYSGVSFYSLKGFGDVAVLATLQILVRRLPPTPTLSKEVFPEDTIYLVSDDRTLRKFVEKTFPGTVELEALSDFLAK